jgi:hypothetical protein
LPDTWSLLVPGFVTRAVNEPVRAEFWHSQTGSFYWSSEPIKTNNKLEEEMMEHNKEKEKERKKKKKKKKLSFKLSSKLITYFKHKY